MTDQNQTAEALARHLHAEQTDKAGAPYIEHLSAVVRNLLRRWPDAPHEAIEAAWLHDALEDTPATPDYLRDAGISSQAVAIIQQVTRPQHLTYRNWIKQLAGSGDRWAIAIKLADNEHNSDPARRLPGSDIVEKRYIPAKSVLEAGIASL